MSDSAEKPAWTVYYRLLRCDHLNQFRSGEEVAVPATRFPFPQECCPEVHFLPILYEFHFDVIIRRYRNPTNRFKFVD